MQQLFLRTIEEFIASQQLLQDADRVIIGLSGGADSVCLLRILCALREKKNLTLLAVHVHHGIRGESADLDAAFAAQLCARMDVTYRLIRADIPALAAQTGSSVEEAGRGFRYEAFEEIRKEQGYDKIAVAHHADDNAETVLLNLCRGSGLAGFGGMVPCSGRIIRPLLCVRRSRIEDYLNEIGQNWRTDETNMDLTCRRNRIRHAVMPQLEAVNPHAVSHINQTARILRESEACLAGQTKEAADACLQAVHEPAVSGIQTDRPCQSDKVDINLSKLKSFDPLIQKRVLLSAMEQVCGSRKDLGQVHVQGLQDLMHLQSGRRLDLPYGMQAQRIYDVIRIEIRSEDIPQETNTRRYEKRDPIGSDDSSVQAWIDSRGLQPGFPVCVCGAGYIIEISVVPPQEADFNRMIRENPYTKFVDCDKIRNRPEVRWCRPQDRITLDAAGHHKTMRRYLIDRKVPQPQRASTAVVADGDRIVWIIGGRIGYEYRLTSETGRILKLEIAGSGTEGSQENRYDRNHQDYDTGGGG